jgi:FkbM family methyltransferase
MKKIFIDCGFHLGEGLKEFTDILNIDSTWDIYAFEANPYCEIEKKAKNYPFKVNTFNKAVWIKDGFSLFNCQNQTSTQSPTEGSTHVLDGWGSYLTETKSNQIFENQVQIETIDFSEFLKQFKDCEVYCKMDIEGAEFEILRKCVEDKTYKLINTLWVEWHDVAIDTESPQTVNKIIESLEGVTVFNWK